MKKIILIICILFSIFLYSQPNTESKNYTKIKLIFYNNNDTIRLVNVKDSKTKSIKSCDKKFEIFSYKTINHKIVEDISTGYFGPGIEDEFKFKHHFLSFDNKHKTGLKIVIVNKKKKMIVDFNINKVCPRYSSWYLNMKIKFKEGQYEVIDAEKPELILIK